MRRLLGSSLLFRQPEQAGDLHLLQRIQAGLDPMFAPGCDPVQVFTQRITQFSKTEMVTGIDGLPYLNQLVPGKPLSGKGGRCQRNDRFVHFLPHVQNTTKLLSKSGRAESNTLF